MALRASARAPLRSPEFQPGCPQQVCAAGTRTSQPASCSSFTAAKATLGRNRSTRQVTNRATFGPAAAVSVISPILPEKVSRSQPRAARPGKRGAPTRAPSLPRDFRLCGRLPRRHTPGGTRGLDPGRSSARLSDQETRPMAELPILEAVARPGTGKGAARAARRDGNVPGVIYGGGQEPISINVRFNVLIKALKAGRFLSTLLNVRVDGTDHRVICRAVQRDIVRDLPVHVDFLRLTERSRINLYIPVEFVNHEESPGLKRGGVLTVVRPEV